MIHDELRPDQLENYALIERSFDQKRTSEVLLAMEPTLAQLQSQKSVTSKAGLGESYKFPESAVRVVSVRISFENFGEVDTMNERYQALVRIKCKW